MKVTVFRWVLGGSLEISKLSSLHPGDGPRGLKLQKIVAVND